MKPGSALPCSSKVLGLALGVLQAFAVRGTVLPEERTLELPAVGFTQLRVLSPTVLELTLVTTKEPDPARVSLWDFVKGKGQLRLPAANNFKVSAGGHPFQIKAVGFKRRVLYAPFKVRDLRIANWLYFELTEPIQGTNDTVTVENPSHKAWPATIRFSVQATPRRYSPVVHVNQTGYASEGPKIAMVGYYLGTLGELELEPPANAGAALGFELLEAGSGKRVYQSNLRLRQDRGFPCSGYQRVWEADFSSFKGPGEFLIHVSGLGTSWPFFIGDGVPGAFARTYALGLYHQRCGTANEMPFTRFTHGPCHLASAEVPRMGKRFESTNEELKKESADFRDNPRHTAPQLKDVSSSLYPFVNKGPVNVAGGHHDAGDYSKYTINSASFVHHLMFAVDVFPGVSELDNLGLPESGDGKSDVLQEALWEANFLARMQDADGGFYFLVYPRDRAYEIDVTPDKGDPQVVWPKTTSATAAATAALAQCASSPKVREQFPQLAAVYLEKARKGWAFLEKAIARHGRDGAYQKITHYGDEQMHDDELVWAACELFLATGEPTFGAKVAEWLRPSDPNFRKWGWWRLFDAYGCAIRSYAFAVKAGKLKKDQVRPLLLEECEAEIAAAGEDQMRRAEASAYGTSFPEETKRTRSGGWYFSSDAAFDLAVAFQLDYPAMSDPRPKLMRALLTNLNFESGCNPLNLSFLTGLGWWRQREIVHQYAQNDRRILPPTGIPLGNLEAGFGWIDRYQHELANLTFPADDDETAPYAFYDRWGDAFNLTQEFVILNQARALGYTAWLMARTPLKGQPWKPVSGELILSAGTSPRWTLQAKDVDLGQARIAWETPGAEPGFADTYAIPPKKPAPDWIEAEAQLPDGRRIFGVTNRASHAYR